MPKLTTEQTQKIDERLKELGLNRAKLAERMNVTGAYITFALKGDKWVSDEQLGKFANALETEINLIK